MTAPAQGGSGGAGTVTRGGRGSMVPAAELRSYYDRPVIKPPVWTWEIPVYFFTGGVSGAAATIAVAAQLSGRPDLARAGRRVAAATALTGPPLLISDLGRPERFHHMLRVIKPTSPMSIGSWTLAGFAPAAIGGALLDEVGWLRALRPLRPVADAVALALGPYMTVYTAVLVADTAVPVWHEARRHLPALFAASATAAGAAAVDLVHRGSATTLPWLSAAAALSELVIDRSMRDHLGDLARPLTEGTAGRWHRAATVSTAAGAVLGVLGRRRRSLRALGAVCAMVGSWCTRWAIVKAGTPSATDPAYTVGPQRERADRVAAASAHD